MIGFYHLVLYLLNRKEKVHLVFSAIAASVIFRMFLTGEKFIFTLFSNFPVGVAITLQHLSAYVLLPLLHCFVYMLFPSAIGKYGTKILRTDLIVSSILICIVLFTPAFFYSESIYVFAVLLIGVGLHILGTIIRALEQRLPGAFVFLLGYSTVIACAVNDILFEQGQVTNSQLRFIELLKRLLPMR